MCAYPCIGISSIGACIHRVYTEWQQQLSGVHSIMMEKLALADEGGGCAPSPTPFHYIYHDVQSCSAAAKRADTEQQQTLKIKTEVRDVDRLRM
jgi:hypothetical protein